MTLRSARLQTDLARCRNDAACPPAKYVKCQHLAVCLQSSVCCEPDSIIPNLLLPITIELCYHGFAECHVNVTCMMEAPTKCMPDNSNYLPEGRIKFVRAGSSLSIASIHVSSSEVAELSKRVRFSLPSDEFSRGVAMAEPTSRSLDWMLSNCKAGTSY